MSAYIKPQLAFDSRGDLSMVPRKGWVFEPKFDGIRWQPHVCPNALRGVPTRVVSFGGRNGVEHSGEQRMIDLTLEELPAGTILDGELCWRKPGELPGPRRAGGDGGRQEPVFVAFDVLAVQSFDVTSKPWKERRDLLEHMAFSYGWMDVGSLVVLSPILTTGTFEEALAAWLRVGLEGGVAKRMDAPYRPGTRRRDGWIKVKPQQDADAVVIDFEKGEGASNKDRCGALTIKLLANDVVTTVGFDCSLEKAEAMIGRTIEIRHHGWQTSGKVRHPVFSRMRPDLEGAAR